MAFTQDLSMLWPFVSLVRLAIICTGTFMLFVASKIIYNLYLHPLRSYPGPFWWRISSIPYDYHLFKGDSVFVIAKFHEKYGPIVRVAANELSFTQSRAWKDVMEHRPEFPKDLRRSTAPPNGIRGILHAAKEPHARFRRLLAHAFSEKGLREQENQIHNYVDLLVKQLQNKTRSMEVLNMCDWYTMTVFDVIGDLAWGESFNGVRDGNVHEWIEAIMGNIKHSVQSAIFTRRGLGLFRPLLMDPKTQTLKDRNYSLAQDRVDNRIALGQARGDFWDRVMIKSADDNKAGEGMTRGEMLVNASVLVLAGAETSATTLSGTTYLLLQNPDKMKKVVEEIRSTFNSSDEINVHSVGKLKYTHAAITEAMRIYPPVPLPAVRKVPIGGGVVCGQHLPENTVVDVAQFSMDHSPDNFYRPLEYHPERWMSDAPPEFANDDRAAHQPFSAGVRNCIGRNLAYAEIRLILSKVLYNFDFELEAQRTGDWLNEQKSYGVWHKGPLYVKLSPAKA